MHLFRLIFSFIKIPADDREIESAKKALPLGFETQIPEEVLAHNLDETEDSDPQVQVFIFPKFEFYKTNALFPADVILISTYSGYLYISLVKSLDNCRISSISHKNCVKSIMHPLLPLTFAPFWMNVRVKPIFRKICLVKLMINTTRSWKVCTSLMYTRWFAKFSEFK